MIHCAIVEAVEHHPKYRSPMLRKAGASGLSHSNPVLRSADILVTAASTFAGCAGGGVSAGRKIEAGGEWG
ncbi:MAG: hypothetical protein PHZ00_01090 [Candidatus Peribacteraceae bacterium]|nr:hypothetical protein [Candidatus Peribacteraceae bacterium]